MLEPRDRALLLECLRPPAGYKLDQAIGTSFSLDLLALLTTPLAFTFYEWEDKDGRPTSDPLALLQAIRANAERIHLFCQAGQICLPKPDQKLVQYLEGCITEVRARDPEGVFHPKVWLMRFTGDGPAKFRFICSSRNLTFDRSWDTILVLDGELIERKTAYAKNHPLGDFVAELPKLAVRPVSAEASRVVAELAEQVRRVDFSPPEGFENFAFLPFGIPRRSGWPLKDREEPLLIISPFLSDKLLRDAAGDRRDCTLVSRAEELERCAPTVLDLFKTIYVLADQGDDEDAETDDEEPPELDQLAGLHAKLYVQDDGWNARVLTGSANATSAAFGKNVEFLTELYGKKSLFGVKALLEDGDGKAASLRDLLQQWVPPSVPTDPSLDAQRLLDDQVARIRRAVAISAMNITVQAEATGDLFTLTLASADSLPAPTIPVAVRCRLASLRDSSAAAVDLGKPISVTFGPVAIEAITSFIAFEIAATLQGVSSVQRFVLNLPMTGAPSDRADRLLRALLKDSSQVLRLIWMLLANDEVSAEDLAQAALSATGSSQAWHDTSGFPLLEVMVRALGTDPARLDTVERLIVDLSKSEEGRALLPKRLLELWEPIRAARDRLRA